MRGGCFEGTLRDLIKGGDGLLLVDIQPDFFPGGRLPVSEGDKIISVVNAWIAAVCDSRIPVYASRDWHPLGHVSFEEQGGPWPPHCLQDTPGAAFHPDLHLPQDAVKVTKGVRFDQDQNSAFDQTGLQVRLRSDGIGHLWIGGLALDVCVLATVLDVRSAGLEVTLILESTRPVSADKGENAAAQIRSAGAKIFS